ncbi:hypothetical protein EDC54_10790 [Samsonia erythrinae]|uniref:Uncharacterized protein n=1 Tax=Samsonia erythrinae TaxID=160434 RepID=A0A4R3VHR8_9GAMM|nr:hypothetical protein EDC54_10790 [Samsonia erythrinae]
MLLLGHKKTGQCLIKSKNEHKTKIKKGSKTINVIQLTKSALSNFPILLTCTQKSSQLHKTVTLA